MLRGCVIMRYGEGESVSVALPLTQPRNIKLKIYAASSQCRRCSQGGTLDMEWKAQNAVRT